MNMQWYDYLRLVTAALALAALYRSGKQVAKNGGSYTRKQRELWWVYNGFLFLLFEGMLEQIALNVVWGPRTILSFLFALVALRATLHADDGHEFIY